MYRLIPRWFRSARPTAGDSDIGNIPIDKVKLPREPFSGTPFADNFKGSWGDHILFVKKVRLFDAQERAQIQQEIIQQSATWALLDHPNVIKFLGHSTTLIPSFLCLVSAWAEHGDVISYLKQGNDLRLALVKILQQVSAGLSYLHSQGCVHGGLRGSNVLVTLSGEVVLSDVGLAPFVERVTSGMAMHGNPSVRFQAPELHDPRKFGMDAPKRTPASDMYSFAMFSIELYTQKAPFADVRHDNSVIFTSLEGARPGRPLPEQCPSDNPTDAAWKVTEGCWAQNPQDRFRAWEVEKQLGSAGQ